ncbi:MAG: ATP-binding cassette domain-containing protein, partial [Bacteroidota bacterium]|nr:ATP-binding cassette domain-containing protein [Bacteroidota bacterium]MDX5506900.1 ATP-binding cassette domain-containing protein [Bacteroidota bacterium]
IYLGMKSAERKSRVNRMLERMDMMHRASHFPAQLSGGQQQRVAVARAVVTEPKLILADEPTGNLDSQQGNEVMEILSELNDQGATIIMVTHSNHDASFSRRIIRLMDGQVISENRMAHA